MSTEMDTPCLRLRAVDGEDVHVLAVLMQDAIVPVTDMLYQAEDNSFIMVAHRFMWSGDERETATKAATTAANSGDACHFHRIRSAIDVRGVGAVHRQGFSPSESERMLDLLTLGVEDNCLHFVFAGGAGLKLALVPDWQLFVTDFGESWPVLCQPEHKVAIQQ